jgi:hypothetical protein
VTATRIGVTGHTDLAPESVALVADGLRTVLADAVRDGTVPLVGLSCLAPGADQLFAEVVLDLGGRVEVVLPAADYRETKVAPAARPRFDDLLRRADRVRTMPFPHAGRAAYPAAALAVLETADLLVAVWDGGADERPGSTAATVAAARDRGLPVTVVWPAGARRPPRAG